MSESNVRWPSALGRAGLPSLVVVAALATAAVSLLRSEPATASGTGAGPDATAATSSSLARRCVGVFVTGDRRTIAGDAKSLVVVGTIPCADRGISGWSTQGVYRAFDDGAVEFLASPIPPCPQGDSYVWIRYPNPG